METHSDFTDEVMKAHDNFNYKELKVGVMNQTVLDEFSTHFAAYFDKANDILVNVYPRNGAKDTAYPAKYIDANKYVPARLERPDLSSWTVGNMQEVLLEAASSVWGGDVAIVCDDPTGVWTIQFQGAKSSVGAGMPEFADKFCSAIDQRLDS